MDRRPRLARSPRYPADITEREIGTAIIPHVLTLQHRLREAPAHRIASHAWRVTEDGLVEVLRDELAAHYRRHGLSDLARRIRSAPFDRACVVLEGEPETRAIYMKPSWWRTPFHQLNETETPMLASQTVARVRPPALANEGLSAVVKLTAKGGR
jgi:hypothetical protein